MLTLYFRGLTSNTPNKLYVVVQDKSGKTSTFTYPQTASLALATWTRWQIPLSDFMAAGVNLAAVKALVIGVGDRAKPTAGGHGVIFIDDIYVGGVEQPLPTVLFAEDFEGLILGPSVEEALKGDHVWTKQAPPGWVHDDTHVPGIGTANDGMTEWAGWSFADRIWWTAMAGDQNRSQFTKGTGAVAIADDDEWDDAGHPAFATGAYYTTYLSTPAIDISNAPAGTIEVKFDSSWRPEAHDDGPGTNDQTATLSISCDGAPAVEILRWSSDPTNPNFHPDNATNETIRIPLDVPVGTKTMLLTFGVLNAGNDWWWAFDNLEVTTKAN